MQGLREESRLLSANQMTLTPQYDQRRGIVTDLLHLLVTSEEPAHYVKSFEHLAAWMDSSLDQYKVPVPNVCRELYHSPHDPGIRQCAKLELPYCVQLSIRTSASEDSSDRHHAPLSVAAGLLITRLRTPGVRLPGSKEDSGMGAGL